MNESEIEILLIEDNPDDAEITLRALQQNNISNNILHLKDGSEALEFLFDSGSLKKKNNKPKVILLDLNMPKVDGIEVLREIKSHVEARSIPVVILTSSCDDPDIETCYQLGANSYIIKPVNFTGFQKVVREIGLYWVLLNQPSI